MKSNPRVNIRLESQWSEVIVISKHAPSNWSSRLTDPKYTISPSPHQIFNDSRIMPSSSTPHHLLASVPRIVSSFFTYRNWTGSLLNRPVRNAIARISRLINNTSGCLGGCVRQAGVGSCTRGMSARWWKTKLKISAGRKGRGVRREGVVFEGVGASFVDMAG